MLHVNLDRGFGDSVFTCNFLVTGAAHDATQDIKLARRQAGYR